MRFFRSADAPLWVGIALVFPGLFLGSKGWIAHGLAFAIITFGLFLMLDRIITERILDFAWSDPSRPEERLPGYLVWVRSFGMAFAFTAAIGSASYFFGRDSWEVGAALVVFPLAYVVLVIVDVVRTERAADKRFR